MMNILKRLVSEEKGQGLAEYGLILALVSLAVIVALGALGTNLNTVFGNIRDRVAGVPTGTTTP